MPVKNPRQPARVAPTSFVMPSVARADRVLFDINPEWRSPIPGICLKVNGSNSIDVAIFSPIHGQMVFEGCVHRDDPIITVQPDRFGGNDSGVWELAPETIRIYDMQKQLDEMQKRLQNLDDRLQKMGPIPQRGVPTPVPVSTVRPDPFPPTWPTPEEVTPQAPRVPVSA